MKQKNMEKIEKILIILILLVTSFLICYQCGTNPIIKNITNVDSSVFIYIGQAMKDGMLPYKDIFDHKGPLLYLINYIGILISNDTYIGIWIIEILFMTVNLIYMYKISRLFIKSEILALIPILISIISVSIYWEGGNFTEEYALPFIFISLYYMVKYMIKSEGMQKKESFIIGACMSCVLLLRINMIPLWIVYCIMIFIDMIRKKRYNEAKNTVIYFLLGVFSVIIICIIVLQINGILFECINDYIIFNFKYITKSSASLIKIVKVFYKTSPLIGISFFICIVDIIYRLLTRKKNILLSISSLIYIVLTFIIVVSPKNYYLHYGIILLPTFLVPILIGIQLTKDSKYRKIILGFLLYAIILFNFDNLVSSVRIYRNLKYNTLEKNNAISNVVNYIKKKTNVDDKIIVMGNTCLFYLETERQAATKYIYQLPIMSVDNRIAEKVKEDTENNNAKLIIYSKDEIINQHMKSIVENLLKDDKYVQIQEIDPYIILERNQ